MWGCQSWLPPAFSRLGGFLTLLKLAEKPAACRIPRPTRFSWPAWFCNAVRDRNQFALRAE
jgi:hypothetical protein